MAVYSIKDLENLSGIKAHTIRIWEKRYNLIEPLRTSTNIRTYDDEDLKRILNISMLNRKGIKISKIAGLCDAEIREKVQHLSRDVHDADSQIENLVLATLDLDESRFDKTLGRSIMQKGFEDTFIDLVYPFFVKIGLMWQVGTINPAQEHFISNLVRQKLLVAIDNTEQPATGAWFMIFLPEGELHELGMLFYTYLLRRRGFRTMYLGQSVPFADLVAVFKSHPADYLLTSFFGPIGETSPNEYACLLSDTFNVSKIIIAGGYAATKITSVPDRTILISHPREFVERVSQLQK